MNTLRIVRWNLDICVAIIFTISAIILNIYGKPFIRGFYLNDESLMLPYLENTVEFSLVLILSVLIPTLVIILVELIVHFKTDQRHHAPGIVISHRWGVLPGWILAIYRVVGLHLTGMAVTQLATDIPKYLIGRLRPHFLTVCEPDINFLNESAASGYHISDDICTGDPEKIYSARFSFPSGHTSMAMYASLYSILYLCHRSRPWPHSRMPILLFNFVLFYLSSYVAVSRLWDYRHHWSDVVGGAALGGLVAVVMIFVFGGKVSPWVAQKSDEEIIAALIASKRTQMYMDNPIFASQESRNPN